MPDVYATITEAAPAVQERIAEIMELRAADPQQRAMLEACWAQVEFPPQARILEIGCGTGSVTRFLATQPAVAEAMGVDPSPVFIAKARELGADLANLTFEQGDGRELQVEDRSFDIVVFHTTLCHIPGSERALAEAFRVMRPGGWLVIFDGDYATTTLATGDFDPLQSCIGAAFGVLLDDQWIVRRLPKLAQSAGFEVKSFRSHGYLQSADADYMLTLADRGADALVTLGRIGSELAAALKAEARRRVDGGEFFGFIGYASLIARKPA